MNTHIKAALALAGIMSAAGATAAFAQAALDPYTAYSYDYYADAAKTQYLGHTWDYGCVQFGNRVSVKRVYLPTSYYDATPMFLCTVNGPWDPPVDPNPPT